MDDEITGAGGPKRSVAFSEFDGISWIFFPHR